MKLKIIIAAVTIVLGALIVFLIPGNSDSYYSDTHANEMISEGQSISFPYQKTEAEWKEILTPAQFRILRGKGTELPFVNEYHALEKDGIYFCAACGQKLFDSRHKYESGSGWPSFWQPINDSLVTELVDDRWYISQTEIVCSNCGGHLGHVFEDGPEPTGLRYCMNSVAMNFVSADSL